MAGGLVIDSNEHFEDRWQIFQRIIIAIMAMGVLFAVLGGTGSGPFATATRTTANAAATTTYQRFETKGTPTRLAVAFRGAAPAGHHSIVIGPEFLRLHRLSSIQPQPISALVGDGGIRYGFATGDGAGTVAITTDPIAIGHSRDTIIVDGEPVAVDQFILP